MSMGRGWSRRILALGDGMFAWMVMPLLRYAQFAGRSRRREYWSFVLLNVAVLVGMTVLLIRYSNAVRRGILAAGGDVAGIYAALFSGPGLILAVWCLAMAVPGAAVSVRRLHDRGLSGWFLVAFAVAELIPRVNVLATLVFLGLMAMAGTAGQNRFGPDPRATVRH